jgi:RNase H-fold protein (predicted Holliday junction resolvase)
MPESPKDKDFDALSKILKEHYEPKPIVIAERYHFHHRNQKPDETIAEYIAELKRLTTHCEFGPYLE